MTQLVKHRLLAPGLLIVGIALIALHYLQVGPANASQSRELEKMAEEFKTTGPQLQKDINGGVDKNKLLLVSYPGSARVYHQGELLGRCPLLLRKQQDAWSTPTGGSIAEGSTLKLAGPPFQKAQLVLGQERPVEPIPLEGLALLPALGLLLCLAAAGAQVARKRALEAEEKLFWSLNHPGEGGRIGRYALEKKLGEGGMAEVLMGRPRDQGPPRAVKILFQESAESPDFQKRFEREVSICQELAHPNIVRVYEHGREYDRYFMVMDLVEGETLREVLDRRQKLPEKEIVALAITICEALSYAHSKEIFHRDLKPENIIMTGDGPKIMDFGLARGERYETITKTDMTLGTPAYMAPEQAQGQRAGAGSDLYSLGCIMYELATGTMPFFAANPIEIIIAHITQPVEAPRQRNPEISEALEKVILSLLEKEATSRPPSAEALKQKLQALS